MWHLYIIRCADSSLYTGIAKDVARRFSEHTAQGRLCAKYLRGRMPLELVFAVEAGDRSSAARMENLLKRLPKSDKERLVSGQMPLGELLCAEADA